MPTSRFRSAGKPSPLARAVMVAGPTLYANGLTVPTATWDSNEFFWPFWPLPECMNEDARGCTRDTRPGWPFLRAAKTLCGDDFYQRRHLRRIYCGASGTGHGRLLRKGN